MESGTHRKFMDIFAVCIIRQSSAMISLFLSNMTTASKKQIPLTIGCQGVTSSVGFHVSNRLTDRHPLAQY